MTFDAEARMRLLFALRSNGITDERVLNAMEKIDRARFVRGVFQPRAYDDTPLPIECGQTISQPSVVGMMTQALDVRPRDKVLEIGCGSGYQAAILSQLARRVYTLERYKPLARSAQTTLQQLDISNVTVLAADGAVGLPEQAPFDRILVTAAAEDVPPALLAQLRIGGIMVVPVGQSDHVQTLLKVTRTEAGPDYTTLGEVRFVPLVEGMGDG
ncbi:Protein-L-isoaspartate O-methyltransferase [Rhodobacteraceae bacterium THAF1]|uniref:protein-L-isoaspartate(D-aspartate) O-methyltransferase n=1 Tax=Palleronia sp. THAF1 TaxID=2587842 RepID=UPI000F3B34DB|nr:protein-L-isoaspartate(D-aspartate) O-methyltransferase [Palleronia sp. THAF1]QFU09370.1 Protein-L-isoaspartate O-methyltransferase [Palleronia sp. THAF1]VDC22045.1 Protein-L-isoaspartate O-methyltransferase [Rhodobacteraceae bacterium THAF1]